MTRDPLQEDTIVAIATPSGAGAIGIVRLSGKLAIPIVARMWGVGALSVDKFASNRMYYGNVIDFSTGTTVDQAMAVVFRAPQSFTGEDVVELHAHGNPLLLERIVDLCRQAGARLAEPGEFSRRAFLNGKIDLSQAEAIADVIAAASAESLRCAQEQLSGRLSHTIRTELDALTGLRAFVEATIDFPEEDIGLLKAEKVREQVAHMVQRLTLLAQTYHDGRLYKDGARVVLVGPPNAGKSSLLNALVGEERALVHHVAGTTRDVVEDLVVWEGVPIRIVDTAGLRTLMQESAADEVEALGIARTHRWADLANLRIVVLDGHCALSMEQQEALSSLPREGVVVWCNKADLGTVIDRSQLAAHFPAAPILCGSAKTGIAITELKSQVIRVLRGRSDRENEGMIITTLRHKEALDEAMNHLQNASDALEERHAPELVAEHLRCASTAVGRIVGAVTTEDLLGEIFSRFCIGK